MQGLEGQLSITTVQLWESLTYLGLSSKFLPGAIVYHYLFIIVCLRRWCVIQTCQNSSHLVCIYFEEKIMKRVFFFFLTQFYSFIVFYFLWKHKPTAQLPFPIPYSCVLFFAFLIGHELGTDWTEITVVTNTKQKLAVEKYAYDITLVVIHHSNELRWRTTNFWSLRTNWELLLVFLWDLAAFTL